MKEIDLSLLKENITYLSKAKATMLLECAVVMLDKHNHKEKVEIKILGDQEKKIKIIFESADNRMRTTYADEDEACEEGAVALAILLIHEFTDYTVIERSRKGTGFDYWLGDKEFELLPPFQKKARLEVSGISQERGTNTVENRVKKKIEQTKQSDDSGLKAIIVVTEFFTPKSKIHTR